MAELFGYQKIKEDILQSFKTNKLHHGLIFCGIEGIGKFSFAKSLAKEITNNESDIENNPDILIIERQLNQKKELKKDITVDSIRKINDFITLTSSISKYRVIIIDSLDNLNKNSSNALLKNLEEPPKNTFFFLINHNENAILDTIKSRCNLLKIKQPSYEDFKSIISSNTLNVKDNETLMLFDASQGSISKALKFYQSNFCDNYKDIIYMISSSKNDKILIKFIEDLIKKDTDLTLTKSLIDLTFNKILKIAKNSPQTEYFEDETILLQEYSNNNDVDDIFKKYEEISNILTKTKSLNLDKKQSLINVFNLIS